jgi:hypothetical protein
MVIFIISFFFYIFLSGFIIIRRDYKTILEDLSFAFEFRNTYIDFVNNFKRTTGFVRSGAIDTSKYIWLQKNSSKMQNILGRTGVVEYVAAFQKYKVRNYQVILNTLPKFREYITDADINMVDDALLRYIGIAEEGTEDFKKELNNPIIWLREGFRKFFGIPFYVFNWLGIIPDNTLSKIISNAIFKIFAGIGGFVAFVSALVTIIQGKEQAIEFIKKIFHK